MLRRGLQRQAWEAWRQVARKFGDVQARILLSGFYFIVLGPFALGLSWKSDPLAIKTGASRGWRVRSEEATPAERARRQF